MSEGIDKPQAFTWRERKRRKVHRSFLPELLAWQATRVLDEEREGEREMGRGRGGGVGGERDGRADSLGGNLFTPRDGNRLIRGVGRGG